MHLDGASLHHLLFQDFIRFVEVILDFQEGHRTGITVDKGMVDDDVQIDRDFIPVEHDFVPRDAGNVNAGVFIHRMRHHFDADPRNTSEIELIDTVVEAFIIQILAGFNLGHDPLRVF